MFSRDGGIVRGNTERALNTRMESTRKRWMDTGEDLVSDGVSPSSDFVRGDGGAILLADEHHLVPFDRIDARDVHHAHIHRNAARNRSAPAAHEHRAVIREPAIIAVVIA